ncbi:MAG: hypothetical protein ACK4NS_06450 [Saprospiraceae bacterium]
MQNWYFIILMFLSVRIGAQSSAWTFHFGPTIATQRWDNSLERQPLFKWHGAISVESVDNDDDRASLYAQLGYHNKGSATRFVFIPQDPGQGLFGRFSEEFRFNNISLQIGAKQKYPWGPASRYFYQFALRGDYTVSTNLNELNARNPWAVAIYPQEGGVRRWVAGVTVGGGAQWSFGELVGAQVAVTVSPDLTLQYFSPQIGNIIVQDPFGGPNRTTTIPERRIRNVAIEVSLGLRLLRKVVYVD